MKNSSRSMNVKTMVLTIASILCAVTIISCNQNSRSGITVDLTKPGAQVAEICRRQQIEVFNHQFEGGLYA